MSSVRHSRQRSISKNQKPADPLKISLPKKSFWRDRTQRIWAFFCPLCAVSRRIPYQPSPGLKHMAQIGLTSIVFTLATWNWFEWKGIVSFLPFWTVFEILYRSRVRALLACSQCGFDPYLYLVDEKRAREVVENYWRKKYAEKGIPFPEKPSSQLKGSGGAQQTTSQPSSDAKAPAAPKATPPA